MGERVGKGRLAARVDQQVCGGERDQRAREVAVLRRVAREQAHGVQLRGRKHHGVRVRDAVAGLPVPREQLDDAVGDLRLARLALLLRQPSQRTGDHAFDVPRKRGVRLGGIDGRGVDDGGPLAFESLQFSFEGVGD